MLLAMAYRQCWTLAVATPFVRSGTYSAGRIVRATFANDSAGGRILAVCVTAWGLPRPVRPRRGHSAPLAIAARGHLYSWRTLMQGVAKRPARRNGAGSNPRNPNR